MREKPAARGWDSMANVKHPLLTGAEAIEEARRCALFAWGCDTCSLLCLEYDTACADCGAQSATLCFVLTAVKNTIVLGQSPDHPNPEARTIIQILLKGG